MQVTCHWQLNCFLLVNCWGYKNKNYSSCPFWGTSSSRARFKWLFNVFLQSGYIRETNADIKEIDAGIKMAENLKPKGCDYGCGLTTIKQKRYNATPDKTFQNSIPSD